jgi:hypothetical protein
MANDAFVQVAVDGAGKKIAMDQGTDAFGNTVLLQKALLVGDPADAMAQMMELQRQQLATLRAILRVLSDVSNTRTTEEDYTSTPGVNFDG